MPKASRPHMPGYGIEDDHTSSGLLPWSWARERLQKSKNYWISTSRPDRTPHCMPVWGIWLDDEFYFSTGRLSRKARNLKTNPKCVVSTERADEAVIIEGLAEQVIRNSALKRVAKVYDAKYGGDIAALEEPIYVVRPLVAFGFKEPLSKSATRWKFDDLK